MLIATDLDGTLVPNGSAEPSGYTADVLRRVDRAGVPVVFVTGRPLRWMEGLWPHVGDHGMAIVSNGAVVYDVHRRRTHQVHGIDRDTGLELVAAIAEAVPDATFAIECLDGMRLDPRFGEDHRVPEGTPRAELHHLWDTPAVKLMVRSARAHPRNARPDHHDQFREQVTAAVGASATATWSMAGLIEISASGITKASALQALCEDLGVDPADVVAFGDMPNDIPMLAWAGTSYAMAQAHPDAQSAADHLAPPVERDGVARVLESIVLGSVNPVTTLQKMPPVESSTFPTTLGEVDLHLVNEGRHEQLWQVLGAHVRTLPDPATGRPVTGTSFAVWAPNARQVSVAGDFNAWDGGAHRLRLLDGSGVWETFVPGVGSGAHYQFLVEGADGVWRHKADPLAFFAEAPPATASRVFESQHVWGDDAWLEARAQRQPVNEPMSTYELHLGSWKRHPDGSFWSYDELADPVDGLPGYLSDLGFTHVELMPVMQHPYGGSWGYHVTSYFAPDARFGDPDGFRRLVDALHQAGIAVILDWVPGHFATDPWALARFDGTALYEHADPQRGWHPEWGSHIFNFGRYEVKNFLVANALYWLEEFHADGLRVDGVASMLYLDYGRKDGEWTPNQHGGHEHLEAVQFLQELNATAYKRVPGIVTIAEESTAWPGVTGVTSGGGLGFGFKWNMGWMHDSLQYLQRDPIHRAYHHGEMTFSLAYAFSENYVLPLSHDEVVHGKGSLIRKMPGDRWQKMANLRAYLAYMWAHPGKQLLMMGCEFAQESEWAEARELDWWSLQQPDHRGMADFVRDLNHRYREIPALWQRDNDPEGFAWIDAQDAGHNVFSFLRRAPGQPDLACVVNFAAAPHEGYRLGLPVAGDWVEVLNTDAASYGGSGVGNLGTVRATTAGPLEGNAPGAQPAHAEVVLPPLATIWLRAPAAG